MHDDAGGVVDVVADLMIVYSVKWLMRLLSEGDVMSWSDVGVDIVLHWIMADYSNSLDTQVSHTRTVQQCESINLGAQELDKCQGLLALFWAPN